MRAFRVADRRHPIFSPTGSMLHGGRWNSLGKSVIYAAETYAGALLEVLVHANLAVVPKNHGVVTITIPDDLAFETVEATDMAGWAAENLVVSRQFGDRWMVEQRSAILIVPSVVLQGRERNILINTNHRDFPRITASEAEPVIWDVRLFPHATLHDPSLQ
jgi:RES domain-containing protein